MLIWLQLLKHMEPIIGTASTQLGMKISIFLRKICVIFFATVSLIFFCFSLYDSGGILKRKSRYFTFSITFQSCLLMPLNQANYRHCLVKINYEQDLENMQLSIFCNTDMFLLTLPWCSLRETANNLGDKKVLIFIKVAS